MLDRSAYAEHGKAPVASVRPMAYADVEEVVAIHLSAFQGFFLSFLGRRFLTLLYEGILRDSSGFAFVCHDGAHLLGFVAGSALPSGLYRRLLLRSWLSFALAALPAFLRRPQTGARLLRALRAPAEATAARGAGTLMSIAVLPEAQGMGVGKLMVHAFLDEGRKRGLSAVDLTTDAVNNESTNRFYSSLGFCVTRVFTTPEGRAMNEYRIEI